MKNIVISVVFAAAAASAQAAADKVREFRYEDGANVLPSYRTWEFSVEEPGLYVFDIAPDDGKTAPAVREWLDGVQIGYVLNSADWKAKTARTLGRLRRFRWLGKGKYRYDLYLNVGGEWTGARWEMGKDWTERGLGRIDGLVRRFGRRRGPRGLLGKIAAPFG